MFIDIHGHAYRKACPFPNRFCTAEELLAAWDDIGVERGVVLPLPGPEVYLPQSNDDIIEMAQKWPDRVIPFCNVDPRALRNSADAPFGDLLRYYKDLGVRGIGELMPNLPFLDPMVLNLLKHAQDVGFPVIFDSTDRVGAGYGLVDDAGLPQLETCLRYFPKLVIVGHGPPFWAEIARLITPADRTTYPKYPVDEEGVVPVLLRRYENLWGDLSATSGFNALNRDLGYAVGFLTEFQDKLMFGTDICLPEQRSPMAKLLVKFRDEGKISGEVFEKIARGNAIRLLGL
jgi:hypothetical protein